MSVYKCKMCGGTIEFEQGATVGVCDSCGTKQTLPRFGDDRRTNMYDRANYFRRNGDFDKAEALFESILAEDSTDSESYWSLVLCRYGISYVEDPRTRRRMPTVNRAQYTPVQTDENYLSAIKYADGSQKEIYEAEARQIDAIQKGILAISGREDPFDVFICYKDTGSDGERTKDSVYAQDIYNALVKEGYKVFFSRITLEGKLGTEYEPYIFAALNSSKVMLAVTTSRANLESVWVKNEWSRYISLIKKGADKTLIPAYAEMSPYELPEEFSHLVAQDMTKIGFLQDLLHGIAKICALPENESPKKPDAATDSPYKENNMSENPLLERMFMFLEDGDFESADEYCERVLDQEPKNARAYLGKLMLEYKLQTEEQLGGLKEGFENSNNYKRIVRYGDDKIVRRVDGYLQQIADRKEYERQSRIYSVSLLEMKRADSEKAYRQAEASFREIPEFKDSLQLAERCAAKAEEIRKNEIYNTAINLIRLNGISSYEKAIAVLTPIKDWKDAEEQITLCRRGIETIRAKEESERLAKQLREEALRIEAERKAEEERLEKERKEEERRKKEEEERLEKERRAEEKRQIKERRAAAKAARAEEKERNRARKELEQGLDEKKHKVRKIAIPATAILLAIALLIPFVIIPNANYNNAIELLNSGNYEQAITAFEALDGYKDSAEQIALCETGILDNQYTAALELYKAGSYEEAIIAFEALDGYKDSADKAAEIYEKNKLKTTEVGDTIYFGSYEQDNDLTNGTEPIEWRVLAKEDNRAFIVSDKALDCRQYNTNRTNVTWESCTLREWLNGTFLDAAFSAEEQAMIQSTTVSADRNPAYSTDPGNATTDKVFLLSINEVNQYFSGDEERMCVPTAYTIAQSAYTSSNYTKDGKATCWWWLRSPGHDQYVATEVYVDGSANSKGYGINLDGVCVRPAMWIDFGSTEDSKASEINEEIGTENDVKNLTAAKTGDIIIFGSYEQDNDLTNGTEPIEWLVLAKKDNKILVISDKALDRKKYNTEGTVVTWETSSLRKWLNGTFLDAAFSAEEQAMIQNTTVSADKNPEYSTDPGNSTSDKVFLLSINEVNRYFSSDEARKCVPTEYAIAQGAYTSSSDTKGGKATCWWWLRSPGNHQTYAASVRYGGSVNSRGQTVHGALVCVRPALWINLES